MIKNRNRAPLFSLVTFVKADIHPASAAAFSHQQNQDSKNYSGLVGDLRFKAEQASHEFGAVARNTEFVDINHLSEGQSKELIQAGRDQFFGRYENTTDGQVLKDLLDFRYARQMPGTNMVLYNPKDFEKASPSLTETLLAHEVGHRVLELRGIWNQREADADEIGAKIVGAQKFVNGLAELARLSPLSNDARFQKSTDNNLHKTDYERAVEIKNRFSSEHVDLSHFPKASGSSANPRHSSPNNSVRHEF